MEVEWEQLSKHETQARGRFADIAVFRHRRRVQGIDIPSLLTIRVGEHPIIRKKRLNNVIIVSISCDPPPLQIDCPWSFRFRSRLVDA